MYNHKERPHVARYVCSIEVYKQTSVVRCNEQLEGNPPLLSTASGRGIQAWSKNNFVWFLKKLGTQVQSLSSQYQATQQTAKSAAAEEEAAAPLKVLAYVYTPSRTFRIPNINYLQLTESGPCQSMRQIIVNFYGQSEAASYPTPGIKTKTFRQNIIGLFKKSKFSLQSPS